MNKTDKIDPSQRGFVQNLLKTVLIVSTMLHTPPQYNQTGQAKTGMVTKLETESRSYLLILY